MYSNHLTSKFPSQLHGPLLYCKGDVNSLIPFAHRKQQLVDFTDEGDSDCGQYKLIRFLCETSKSGLSSSLDSPPATVGL